MKNKAGFISNQSKTLVECGMPLIIFIFTTKALKNATSKSQQFS
jgi:hypothetical protein